MARLLYPGRIANFREQGAKDKAPRKKKTLLGATAKGAAIGLGTGALLGAGTGLLFAGTGFRRLPLRVQQDLINDAKRRGMNANQFKKGMEQTMAISTGINAAAGGALIGGLGGASGYMTNHERELNNMREMRQNR